MSCGPFFLDSIIPCKIVFISKSAESFNQKSFLTVTISLWHCYLVTLEKLKRLGWQSQGSLLVQDDRELLLDTISQKFNELYERRKNSRG
jgi:hypothetical protein